MRNLSSNEELICCLLKVVNTLRRYAGLCRLTRLDETFCPNPYNWPMVQGSLAIEFRDGYPRYILTPWGSLDAHIAAATKFWYITHDQLVADFSAIIIVEHSVRYFGTYEWGIGPVYGLTRVGNIRLNTPAIRENIKLPIHVHAPLAWVSKSNW